MNSPPDIIMSSDDAVNTPSASSTSLERHFKRKFEDVMESLDEAVGQSSFFDPVTPPPKKAKLGRSFYATLAKYGIKKDPKPTNETTNKLESLSKTAPHLAAILSRTASRTRKALPFRNRKSHSEAVIPTNPNSEYRPSSTASFLSRLATYKLTTYANKPTAIDAVAAAKCGWINEGKDRLACGICNISWVVAGKAGMSKDAGNALVEKQRAQLVDMHKSGCPWKTNQCDSSIYRVPLQTPAVMVRELKARAGTLESVLQGVHIKHPLTSTQVQSLVSIIQSVKNFDFTFSFNPSSTIPQSPPPLAEPAPSVEPSETAILVSLFGWSLPPPPPPPPERKRLPSLSRATSIAPSTPATPARLRAPSVTFSPNMPLSPSPSRPPRLPRAETMPSSIEFVIRPKSDSTCLVCMLCQRRVGLWAFLSDTAPAATTGNSRPVRQFDILKEHRSYCPYAVRSTILPTPPAPRQSQSHGSSRSGSILFRTPSSSSSSSIPPPGQLPGDPGVVEGWRAVLTVVQRYGAAKRQRFGLSSVGSESPFSNESNEASRDVLPEKDEVEAMVAEVKSHGGRDLLRYVKGLLG